MNGRVVVTSCVVVMVVASFAHLTRTSVPIFNVEQEQGYSEGRTTAYPPAMGGPDVVQPMPPTAAESRRTILHSVDLLEAVLKITSQSPTIDKLAASEALMACADFRPKGRREREDETAAEALDQRCAGIRQHMRRNDAIEKAIELLASAESDSSSLGRLTSLSRRFNAGSVQWDKNDLALVNGALRSTDAVLVRAATRALLARLDDGLPDSRLRVQALELAFKAYVLNIGDQETAFDALVACANRGNCGTDWAIAHFEDKSAALGAREGTEVKRLAEQYRLALQRGIAVSDFLALR